MQGTVYTISTPRSSGLTTSTDPDPSIRVSEPSDQPKRPIEGAPTPETRLQTRWPRGDRTATTNQTSTRGFRQGFDRVASTGFRQRVSTRVLDHRFDLHFDHRFDHRFDHCFDHGFGLKASQGIWAVSVYTPTFNSRFEVSEPPF